MDFHLCEIIHFRSNRQGEKRKNSAALLVENTKMKALPCYDVHATHLIGTQVPTVA
jgi:hypothetical protein